MNDVELRERLLAGVPDHRSGFWSDLSRTLAADASTETGAAVPPTSQGDAMSTFTERPTDLDAYRSSSAIRGRRARWLVATGWAAAAAVVIGAGVVALRLGSGPQDSTPAVTTSTASTPTPAGSISASPTAPSSVAPSSAASSPAASSSAKASSSPSSSNPQTYVSTLAVTRQDGVQQLTRAGLTLKGDYVGGWYWNDLNGRNLVVLEREWKQVVGPSNNPAQNVSDSGYTGTLTVVHLANVLGPKPTVLRILTQPSLPGGGPNRSCDTEPMLDFVRDGDLQVSDVDHDGYAEVRVAWYMLCGGGNPGLEVRLAYLSNGQYYILRGVARVRSIAYDQGIPNPPKPTYTADPAPASWPQGLVALAKTDFDSYFN